MRRAAPLLILLLLATMVVGSPASAGANDARRSPEVRHVDRQIHTAERRIRTWDRRLQRWHRHIRRAAVAVERLTERAEGTVPIRLDGLMHGFPTRELDVLRLRRAHRSLRAVLKDPRARRAQRELDAWSARLVELRTARDRLALEPAAPATEAAPAEPAGPLTYERWARSFLDRLGAPDCSENLTIVVTWETSESTDAVFNPLATTHAMEGASDFNSVGVKNYRSLRQGLDASRDTLLGGAASYGYGAIVTSLQACASAEATALAINASAWCRGCVGGTYITGLLPLVRADYAGHASRRIATGRA